MMTITIPFLQAMDACEGGLTWCQNYFNSKGITEDTYDNVDVAFTEYCNANPSITVGWIQWYHSLLTNPQAIMYFSGWFYTNQFKMFNIITGQYDSFTSLSDAKAKSLTTQQEYIVLNKSRFSVNIDIDNPDGSTTWMPVDPFTFDQEDDYQVFNTFTGQYTTYNNLADAQAAERAVEKQVGELAIRPIEQLISSADGQQTAWVII